MNVALHPDLAWDYDEPPADALWRLQRIADAFPAYGRDRQTVGQLVLHLSALRLRSEVRALILIYEDKWRQHEAHRRGG